MVPGTSVPRSAAGRALSSELEGCFLKLLSILLLSYRNLDRVYGTLDSIFRQDYPALELVVSDDASPDFAAQQPLVSACVRSAGSPIRKTWAPSGT